MKKPNDFKQQFVDFINRHDLITSGDHIGIAVSGGIDSMTLLDLFERARDEFRLKLCVLHFNHQLRDQAERDQTFVENACRQKNITFIIDSADVAAFAKTQNLSIEMAARELRYAFFEKTAQKLSLNKIATGHNASDQAETVLDHIVRGTGIGGLAGIPVKRDRYIRPLLFSERIDIEKYAEQESISFRIDASNVDQIFKRNRIRHSLLPLLQKEFNPQITRSINRLSDHAIEANTIIENVVDEAFHNCAGSIDADKIVLEFKVFLAYLNSLQRLVLRRVFVQLGLDPNLLTYSRFGNVQQFLRKSESGAFRFATNLYIIISGESLIFSKNNLTFHSIPLKTKSELVFLWDNLFLEIKASAKPLTLENKNRATEFIDADSLEQPLLARSYQTGDFFYPINGMGKKKVTDYFIDAKIPFYERPNIPILASSGNIVWICGHRLDDRYKLTEKSKSIYKIKLVKRER